MSFGETLIKIVQTILIMSATGSIIALLLFALKPIVKNHLPKNTQYYLWVLVLVAFLVPFSTFVSLPFATPMTAVQEVIDQNIIATDERYEKIAQEQHNKPFESLQTNEQAKIIYENKQWDYNRLLTIPISCGITIFLISIFQYLSFCRKLYHQRIPAKENEIAMLNQLHTGKRKPHLYRNGLAPTPMLIGMFSPIIYLPNRDYSDMQLKNILLHELTHLQRCDVVIKWIASIVVYIHWFNPVAYLVRREIDKVCELACDEAVITNLDIEGKQSYGNTLIEVAGEMKKPSVLVSTTMCEEKKTLKDRLSAIMHSKKPTKKVVACSCALLAVAICAIIVLGSSANHASAVDALFRKYGNEADVIRPQSIITEVDAGDDGTVIFYYNANNNLACAIAEQGIFGYTIVKNGAELTVESGTPVSVMAGQYNKVSKWRAWGILRDSEITKAIIYGQEATIVEAEGLRLFYMIGDGEIPDDYYTFYNGAGELVWEIGANAPQYNEDELLPDILENAVPEGLTLEITSAAQIDAEFLLSNMTEHIVEYGYVNRVEQYVDGEWEPAISETKEIFPEDPEPLQAGERLYGMAAWVRDNTELPPGNYRYLMLINVRDGDLPAYPVVLEAPFEITE